MKLKYFIFVVPTLLISTFSKPAIAQSDSVGKKNYAYAYFYSSDNYTEYISSVFCWTKNSSGNSPEYPNDYLTAIAKSLFTNNLPDIKVRRCTCRFEIDSSHYYTSDEAQKSWNLKISEFKNQNINATIISFPDCIHK
jgi:hypothetical protein